MLVMSCCVSPPLDQKTRRSASRSRRPTPGTLATERMTPPVTTMACVPSGNGFRPRCRSLPAARGYAELARPRRQGRRRRVGGRLRRRRQRHGTGRRRRRQHDRGRRSRRRGRRWIGRRAGLRVLITGLLHRGRSREGAVGRRLAPRRRRRGLGAARGRGREAALLRPLNQRIVGQRLLADLVLVRLKFEFAAHVQRQQGAAPVCVAVRLSSWTSPSA